MERIEAMETREMPHPKHGDHLCYLENIGYIKDHFEEYKELVRNARYVCRNCGRSAVNEDSLCKPDKL
jgi:hypothetical protein